MQVVFRRRGMLEYLKIKVEHVNSMGQKLASFFESLFRVEDFWTIIPILGSEISTQLVWEPSSDGMKKLSFHDCPLGKL